MNQKDKARKFKELHVQGQPVLLYDAWDVGSAKAFAQAGAGAIATSNWAIAAALGYADGGMVPKQVVTEITAGIVEAVDLPVSVDFHGGYSENNDELAKNVSRLLQAGAVGINFEDRILGRSGPRPIDQQAERISVIRGPPNEWASTYSLMRKRTYFSDGKTDTRSALMRPLNERTSMLLLGLQDYLFPGLWQEVTLSSKYARGSRFR